MAAELKVVSVHLDTWGKRLDGISDMDITVVDGVPILLIGSEAESAVTTFTLDQPVNPSRVSQIDYSEDSGTQVLNEIETYQRDGNTYAITLGRFDDNYGHYQIDSEGNMDFLGVFGGEIGPHEGNVSEMVHISGRSIFLTAGNWHNGIRGFVIDEDGVFTSVRPEYDDSSTLFKDVVAMDTANLFGDAILATGAALDSGIHLWLVRGNGDLRSQFMYEPSNGLGFHAITDIQFIENDGKNFLIVSASGTHSLTVLRVTSDLSVFETDSYIDTGETRFANATCMKSFSYGDRTFIVVAGSDEGVTLFELDYRGKLTLLDVITDDFDTTLANVSDLEVHIKNNFAFIYVGSSQDHGFTVLKYNMERSGDEVFGNKYNNKGLRGTKDDDVVWGKQGNDKLVGFGGDDRLVDGFGADKLAGGAGEDVFVFVPDTKKDWILDYEPGTDKIDLSDYANLWHISSLNFEEKDDGTMLIFVKEDKIHVVHKNDETLTSADFTQDDFIFG